MVTGLIIIAEIFLLFTFSAKKIFLLGLVIFLIDGLVVLLGHQGVALKGLILNFSILFVGLLRYLYELKSE